MGKHLDFYNRCLKSNRTPNMGLCNCTAIDQKLLNLFLPTELDLRTLLNDNKSTVFWASDFPETSNLIYWTFTPLRQTIVLFMATMNNEL